MAGVPDEERLPFDPNDPFDSVSDYFRGAVCTLILAAMESHPLYGKLDQNRQLEAFICGALVGIVGGAFAHIKSDNHAARETVMKYIEECLPVARRIAEEIEAANDKTSTRQ